VEERFSTKESFHFSQIAFYKITQKLTLECQASTKERNVDFEREKAF
jgi:hypothetical protein